MQALSVISIKIEKDVQRFHDVREKKALLTSGSRRVGRTLNIRQWENDRLPLLKLALPEKVPYESLTDCSVCGTALLHINARLLYASEIHLAILAILEE